VRDFHLGDLANVLQIAGASSEGSQWAPEDYASLATRPGFLLLVADSNSGVSGFLAARSAGGEAEVLNLAVNPTQRRAGIGSALLTAALQRFEQQRLDSVYLEVRNSNAAAMGLYSKHGFSVANRRKNYYRDPVEDAICMMKKLTDRVG